MKNERNFIFLIIKLRNSNIYSKTQYSFIMKNFSKRKQFKKKRLKENEFSIYFTHSNSLRRSFEP